MSASIPFANGVPELSETSYQITITPDITNLHEDGTPEPPSMILKVTYPPKYPDVAPDLELFAPPNASKHPHIDITESKDRLLDSVRPTIEDNMGMVMIFAIAGTLEETAQRMVEASQSVILEAKAKRAQEEEQAENRKFQGTPVTRETFIEWSERFTREMEEKEQERIRLEEEAEEKNNKKKGSVKKEKKLTGKQLFERGLTARLGDDEDYDEDENDVSENVQKLEIAA